MSKRERVLHCWEPSPLDAIGLCDHWPDGVLTWPELEALDPKAADECKHSCWMGMKMRPSGTCMLRRGHAGPHRFTDDEKITISFAASEGGGG